MGARIRNRLPDWFLASSQDELLSKSGIVSIVNRETICSTFIHRWNMFYGYKEFVWSWLDKNHWHSGKLKNCISAWTLKDKISSCNVFVLSKLTSLVTLSDRKPQIFKKEKKTHQNRPFLACNVEWDFFLWFSNTVLKISFSQFSYFAKKYSKCHIWIFGIFI